MGIRFTRAMMLMLAAVTALLAREAWADPGAGESRVRCESQEGRWAQCPLPPGSGDTVMLRQLSRNACIRNNSWGTNEGGLWVARGCRAEFGRERMTRTGDAADAASNTNTRSRLLRCESRNGGHRQCPIETAGGVRLTRKLSDGDCELGKSWGYDESGIWVARGCRAEFEVTTAARPSVRFFQRLMGREPRGTIAGHPLRCESVDGKRSDCKLPAGSARVELVNQLSKAGCAFGKSWGWNANRVWVAEGCRAEFMAWPAPPAE